MEKRLKLSSNSTWLYKYFLLPGIPVVFILIGCNALLDLLFYQTGDDRRLAMLMAVLFFVTGCGLGFWLLPLAWNLKDVFIDCKSLIVSGTTRTTEISFSSIESVDLIFSSLQLIKVSFSEKNTLGRKIYFIPQGYQHIFSNPPAYYELLNILEQTRRPSSGQE